MADLELASIYTVRWRSLRAPKEEPVILYTLEAKLQLQVNEASWEDEVFRRSLFILATNQEIDSIEKQEELPQTYKEQHSVEREFRFIEELQAELDVWIDWYNKERTHWGKHCYGKTPWDTFIQSKHLALEKQVD